MGDIKGQQEHRGMAENVSPELVRPKTSAAAKTLDITTSAFVAHRRPLSSLQSSCTPSSSAGYTVPSKTPSSPVYTISPSSRPSTGPIRFIHSDKLPVLLTAMKQAGARKGIASARAIPIRSLDAFLSPKTSSSSSSKQSSTQPPAVNLRFRHQIKSGMLIVCQSGKGIFYTSVNPNSRLPKDLNPNDERIVYVTGIQQVLVMIDIIRRGFFASSSTALTTTLDLSGVKKIRGKRTSIDDVPSSPQIQKGAKKIYSDLCANRVIRAYCNPKSAGAHSQQEAGEVREIIAYEVFPIIKRLLADMSIPYGKGRIHYVVNSPIVRDWSSFCATSPRSASAPAILKSARTPHPLIQRPMTAPSHVTYQLQAKRSPDEKALDEIDPVTGLKLSVLKDAVERAFRESEADRTSSTASVKSPVLL